MANGMILEVSTKARPTLRSAWICPPFGRTAAYPMRSVAGPFQESCTSALLVPRTRSSRWQTGSRGYANLAIRYSRPAEGFPSPSPSAQPPNTSQRRQYSSERPLDRPGRVRYQTVDPLTSRPLDPRLIPPPKAPQGWRKGANLPSREIAVKTRFAPSPTGYLHIGGLRTALFSYLLARRCGGKFILRIEDTDQKRLVADAEQRLIQDLQWAGLQWDEGPGVDGPHGPYRQSERTEIYQQHARELLNRGSAYRCFCTPQSAGDAKAEYVTSGCYQSCSSLPADQSKDRAEADNARFTVRLKSSPDFAVPTVPDLVHGRITRLQRGPSAPAGEAENGVGLSASDTILMKSDGTPTYHFANVVDDHLMEITHVIRGEEWLASTPLHFDIYAAFGWRPPLFAHVGLLVDQHGAKLSKRNADMALDVGSVRDQHHVLPIALNNFLLLLGWTHPSNGGSNVMDMKQMASVFDLKLKPGNVVAQMDLLWALQRKQIASLCERAEAENSVEPILGFLEPFVREVKKEYPSFVPPVADGLGSEGELDPLVAYCREIVLAAPRQSFTAAERMSRDRSFFERPSQDEALLDPTMTKATARVLHALDHDQPYDQPPDVSVPAGVNFRPTRQPRVFEQSRPFQVRERKTNAILNQQTWVEALERYVVSTQNADSSSIDLPAVPLLFEGFATPKMATFLLSTISRTEPAAKEVMALATIYKEVHPAFMRHLRFRLFGQAQGPAVSTSMTILGRDECRARLEKDTAGAEA